MGDRCSIRRPTRQRRAVPRRAVLLPAARQGIPLAAQQEPAAAPLAVDTQQARVVGQAARRRAAEAEQLGRHPIG